MIRFLAFAVVMKPPQQYCSSQYCTDGVYCAYSVFIHIKDLENSVKCNVLIGKYNCKSTSGRIMCFFPA